MGRIGEARDELARMLSEDELRDAVLLVFANKQDLPNALKPSELTEKLGLQNMRNRNWYIQATCAAAVFHAQQFPTLFSLNYISVAASLVFFSFGKFFTQQHRDPAWNVPTFCWNEKKTF